MWRRGSAAVDVAYNYARNCIVASDAVGVRTSCGSSKTQSFPRARCRTSTAKTPKRSDHCANLAIKIVVTPQASRGGELRIDLSRVKNLLPWTSGRSPGTIGLERTARFNCSRSGGLVTEEQEQTSRCKTPCRSRPKAASCSSVLTGPLVFAKPQQPFSGRSRPAYRPLARGPRSV